MRDGENGGYFFDDAKDGTLLARSKEWDDMALPSGNSISALNLLRAVLGVIEKARGRQ